MKRGRDEEREGRRKGGRERWIKRERKGGREGRREGEREEGEGGQGREGFVSHKYFNY